MQALSLPMIMAFFQKLSQPVQVLSSVMYFPQGQEVQWVELVSQVKHI